MAKVAKWQDYEILFEFTIMYAGWECDDKAWIAKDKKGKLVYLGTSHGGLYDYGQDVSGLHDKLKELRDCRAGIKKAMEMLK